MSEGHVAPITSSERIGELDALRGLALLGVFIANYVWFFYLGFSAPDASRDVWNANPTEVATVKGVMWLVSDKANTLFGTLFGIGFWVQMTRMQARIPDANRIYLRRLAVLLAMGAINLFLLWPWDILFVYALAGFLLFALRGLASKVMLVLGGILFLAARPTVEGLSDVMGIAPAHKDLVFSDAAVEARHDVIINGNYADWIGEYAYLNGHGFFLSGLILGWILYSLGRFLIGAWIARQGWLERIAELRTTIGRIAIVAIPLGLALEYVHLQANFGGPIDIPDALDEAVHMVGLMLTALGYATGFLWLFHSRSLGWFPRLFAPVGRMALTNYITHGIVALFVLTGVGPGLALAGRMPPTQSLALAFGTFAVLTVFSHLWLSAYRYGPLEYLWRTLTYGHAPAFRRKARLQPA